MKRPLCAALALSLALTLLSACGGGEYISVASVGKYDSSVITNMLLQKSSSLPNATESSLPRWQGGAILCRADTDLGRHERAYSESDIAFLSGAGMNFARLELDFSTLQYPGYPAEGDKVNSSELLELDTLLSWCMKYDVHLCIAMAGLPGEGKSPKEPGDLFTDSGDVLTAAKFWKMLAHRYSPISSRYLSFCLISAPAPPSADAYALALAPLAAAIRTISPERALIADVSDAEEAAAAAGLGLSLSYSLTVSGGATAAESWFEAAVKPIRAVAKEYSVGMMIGSLGIRTGEDLGESYYDYYSASARCVNENGLGWCLYALWGGSALINDGNEFLQSGAEPRRVSVSTSGGTIQLWCDARLLAALTGQSIG